MAINEKLLRLLEEHQIQVEVLPHRTAFTAEAVAQTCHIPLRRLAKVVVLRDGPSYVMVVVPALEHVDLHIARHITGRPGLRLATEDELVDLFPDCAPGAMPPFGRLYGISMYLDACLPDEEIYFQAGNHYEVVRMKFDQFARLAHPFVSDVCLHLEPSFAA